MKQETISFFEELVWHRRRPLPELFNAQFTYLTPALATHYGITPKDKEIYFSLIHVDTINGE